MRREHESHVLRAAALGAIAMYLLDPDNGRRRRAIARDKAMSLVQHAGEVVTAAGRDIANPGRGVQASAMQRLRGDETADDLQLIERVRARIGRVVSHPHAIQVGARDGRIVLSGPVLAHEVGALVGAASAVRGVRGVDEYLDVHDAPGSVPSLQGEGRRRNARGGPQSLRGPEARAAAVLGGGMLVLAGLARGSATGLLLAALGAGLAAQGAGTRLLPSPANGRGAATEQGDMAVGDRSTRAENQAA